MKHYECVICLNVNHASRLHCSTCGTVPAQYSFMGVPVKPALDEENRPAPFIEVIVAHGVDRQEHHHIVKTMMRTVPLDYYASA